MGGRDTLFHWYLVLWLTTVVRSVSVSSTHEQRTGVGQLLETAPCPPPSEALFF